MAEKSYFWDTVAADRTYSSADFADSLNGFGQGRSGVVRSGTTALEVTNPGTLNAVINTGACVFNGRVYTNSASVSKVLAAPSLNNKRIDRIVVRFDASLRTAVLTVIQGTETTGTPSAPAIDALKDVLLGYVQITNTAGSYTYAVVDERSYNDQNISASNLVSGTIPVARLSALTGDVSSSAGSNSVDLVAASVLSKLLTVDGSGSGLDADLVRGTFTTYGPTDNTAVSAATVRDLPAMSVGQIAIVNIGYTSTSGTIYNVTINLPATGTFDYGFYGNKTGTPGPIGIVLPGSSVAGGTAITVQNVNNTQHFALTGWVKRTA